MCWRTRTKANVRVNVAYRISLPEWISVTDSELGGLRKNLHRNTAVLYRLLSNLLYCSFRMSPTHIASVTTLIINCLSSLCSAALCRRARLTVKSGKLFSSSFYRRYRQRPIVEFERKKLLFLATSETGWGGVRGILKVQYLLASRVIWVTR